MILLAIFDHRGEDSCSRKNLANFLNLPVLNRYSLKAMKRIRFALALFCSCSVLFPSFARATGEKMQTHDISVEKELLITHPKVVDSELAEYPGPLSFGKIIEELAGKRDPAEFMEEWCGLWEKQQTVNSFKVPGRKGMRDAVIGTWQQADGYEPSPEEPIKPWKTNLSNAPFRLLAIANRVDLVGTIRRDKGLDENILQLFPRRPVNSTPPVAVMFGGSSSGSPYYSTKVPGELRIVYTLVDPVGEPVEGGFNVILEYPLMKPKEGITDLKEGRDWLARQASQWHALGALEFDDPNYLSQLGALVSAQTSTSDETTPVIRQMRTNDGAFGKHREFRECRIVGGKWVQQPVAGTPATQFAVMGRPRSRLFAKYINENAEVIVSGSNFVSPTFRLSSSSRKGLPFLGGSAHIPATSDNFHWNAKGIRNNKARRMFSMNTCNGCHARETGTKGMHVSPRRKGEESQLSAFLKPPAEKPLVIRDPVSNKGVGLDEMGLRKTIYELLLNPQWSKDEMASGFKKRAWQEKMLANAEKNRKR
jgi:hypothetical protein